MDMVTESGFRNLSDSLHTRSTSTDGMSKNKDDKLDGVDLVDCSFVDVDVLDEYPILCGDSVMNSPSLRGSSVNGATSKSSLGREKEGLQRKRSLTGMMMGFGGKKDGSDNISVASTVSSSSSAVGATSAPLKGFVEMGGMQYPVDSSDHTAYSTSTAAAAAASSPVSITSSRPLFYPSPSGGHCAVFWPESSYYMVFSVKVDTTCKFRRHPSAESSSSRRGSGRPRRASMQRIIELDGEEDLDLKFSVRTEEEGGEESFNEVDKGRCLSFAWVGTSGTYAILTPGLRCESNASRRSSIGAMFSRAEKERGHYIPPRMVFKVLPTGGTEAAVAILVDTASLGDASQSSANSDLPQEIFGGLLLCVSTPLRSSGKNADGVVSGGQKAVSKIEADAIAQQQIEIKKEQLERDKGKDIGGKKSKSSSASIESIVTASAQALEEAVGGGGEFYRASQRSRFYAITSAVKAKKGDMGDAATGKSLSLQAVGPYMSGVRSVTWDAATGLCAVLIGLTVNILRLEVTSEGQGQGQAQAQNGKDGVSHSAEWGQQSSVVLSVIASVDLQSYTCTATSTSFSSPYLYPVTFSWHNGQLYALTSTEMLQICTENPYLAHSDSRRTAVRSKGERTRGGEALEASTSSVARREPSVDIVIVASSTADALCPTRSKNLNTYVDGTTLSSYQPHGSTFDGDFQRSGSHPGSRALKLKRTMGWLDLLGGRKGNMLLSSR